MYKPLYGHYIHHCVPPSFAFYTSYVIYPLGDVMLQGIDHYQIASTMPGRSWRHKSAAFQLLESKLPVHWHLRIVVERERETVCLLEVVQENKELKGAAAWIRLIASDHIPFNEQGLYELPAVQQPAQYRDICEAPLFIVMAGLDKKQVYFLPVDYYIQRHFHTLLQQERPTWLLDSRYLLEGERGIMLFQWRLQQQLDRKRLENEIVFFLANYTAIRDQQEVLFPIAIDRNFNFLCHYFNLDFPIARPSDLVFNAGAGAYHHTRRRILLSIAALLQDELSYWAFTNPALYYYLHGIIRLLV